MIEIKEICGFSVLKGELNFLYLMDGENLVGKFKWRCSEKYVEVIEVFIELEYRRLGIATEIYRTLQRETGKDLKWIRNAFASNSMKLLSEKYIDENKIISDDGNIVIVRRTDDR